MDEEQLKAYLKPKF
jgi:hypothetical protein